MRLLLPLRQYRISLLKPTVLGVSLEAKSAQHQWPSSHLLVFRELCPPLYFGQVLIFKKSIHTIFLGVTQLLVLGQLWNCWCCKPKFFVLSWRSCNTVKQDLWWFVPQHPEFCWLPNALPLLEEVKDRWRKSKLKGLSFDLAGPQGRAHGSSGGSCKQQEFWCAFTKEKNWSYTAAQVQEYEVFFMWHTFFMWHIIFEGSGSCWGGWGAEISLAPALLWCPSTSSTSCVVPSCAVEMTVSKIEADCW